MAISERAIGAMDAAVYAAEEIAQLRTINAKLLAVCESVLNWDCDLHGPSNQRWWKCRLCSGTSITEQSGPEAIDHAEGCPIPQIENIIAKGGG